MADVRVLLFDFGNVIGFFDHHRGAAQVAELLRAEPRRVYDFFFGTDLEDRFDKGLITSDELLVLLRREFDAHEAPAAELERAFGSIFWRNEPVIEVIRRVPRSVRLMLGSNTNDLHYRNFSRMFADVFERFDRIILSHEVCKRKPDPEFFRVCLDAAGCAPDEMLFLDDKVENVASARSLGIRGVEVTPDLDLARVLRENGISIG
jgi:HAD superfamily hydrolase (TIGR01509 family)